MLQHHEIKLMNISTKQKDILLAYADYNEGWITEKELEDKLTKIINQKNEQGRNQRWFCQYHYG